MILMLDGTRSAPQSFEDFLQWLDLFGNDQRVPKRAIAYLIERISADLPASPVKPDNVAVGPQNHDRTSRALDDRGSEIHGVLSPRDIDQNSPNSRDSSGLV